MYFPKSIKTIGKFRFTGWVYLVSAALESGSDLRAIAAETFSRCSSLAPFPIPPSIEAIGVHCFSCTSIWDADLRPATKRVCLELNIFDDLTVTESLRFPSSVQKIVSTKLPPSPAKK
jgi:hypothetical protein